MSSLEPCGSVLEKLQSKVCSYTFLIEKPAGVLVWLSRKPLKQASLNITIEEEEAAARLYIMSAAEETDVDAAVYRNWLAFLHLKRTKNGTEDFPLSKQNKIKDVYALLPIAFGKSCVAH